MPVLFAGFQSPSLFPKFSNSASNLFLNKLPLGRAAFRGLSDLFGSAFPKLLRTCRNWQTLLPFGPDSDYKACLEYRRSLSKPWPILFAMKSRPSLRLRGYPDIRERV